MKLQSSFERSSCSWRKKRGRQRACWIKERNRIEMIKEGKINERKWEGQGDEEENEIEREKKQNEKDETKV